MQIFNIPVLFIWLWHAIRRRDLFFFALTNPGIPTGGFFGESKSSILQHIPEEFKPTTILWKAPIAIDEIEHKFSASGLMFPVIVKPEIGERGWLISPIHSMDELKTYITAHPIDIILQPFLKMPLEVSIMVHRFPETRLGSVTSICEKEFLHVTGDGKSTLRDLIIANDRAFLQLKRLNKKHSELDCVLQEGEYFLLEPVGNHCRGTKFINRNERIDTAITGVLSGLLQTMPGVWYGRFDMKINSWDDLRAGKGIQVMEFNGTASDPAHIYDPSYSIVRAYSDIFRHWKIMADIAGVNRQLGKKPVAFKKIITDLILYFRYKRTNN